MSSETFLVKNDFVQFNPPLTGPAPGTMLCGPAMTVVTSPHNAKDHTSGITILGNEKDWKVASWPYMLGPLGTLAPLTPGVVECKIMQLNPLHISPFVKYKNKNVLLVGSAPFIAIFTVKTPAQFIDTTSGATIPDPCPVYMGQGIFIQANPTASQQNLAGSHVASVQVTQITQNSTTAADDTAQGSSTTVPAARPSAQSTAAGPMPQPNGDTHPGVPACGSLPPCQATSLPSKAAIDSSERILRAAMQNPSSVRAGGG